MNLSLTSLDLHYITKDLKILEAGRVDKVYCAQDHYVMGFYVQGVGKLFLHFKPPGMMYLSENKQIVAEDTGFSKTLRKHLANAKLKSINQYHFERILVLDFGEKKIIFELFDKGNMLLLSEDTIVSAIRYKKTRDRMVRGGTVYVFPKNRDDIFSMHDVQLKEKLEEQDQAIVKTLARNLSLGGNYAEELCLRSGIAKDVKKLNAKELDSLKQNLHKMLQQEPRPTLYPSLFAPMQLQSQESIKSFKTFSQLLETISQEKVPSAEESSKVKKIKTIIKKQQELLENSMQQHEVNNLMGSKIYEHFTALDQLLKQLNILKKEKGWPAVVAYANSKNFTVHTNKATVEIDIP